MRNRLMTSVAILTMLVGTSAALGQSPGSKEAPSGGTSTQHSPPAQPRSDSGPSGTTQMNRSQSPDSKGAASRQEPTQSGESSKGSPQNAPGIHSDKSKGPDNTKGRQSTDDRSKGERMKNSESGDDRGKDRMNTERRGTGTTGDTARHPETRSQTTGQAGAGAKLSSEQRTRITSVIHQQRVQPETNVNFNISVGTRVPRTVHFHPLPAEIITVYPDWRGYQFFLVRDQIVVVNPRTFEIVAVLEA